MKNRFLAAVFVLCCLLLCGLILRRQITTHPLPPETAQRFEDGGEGRGGQGQRTEGWHPASPTLVALAHQAIAGQLAALKAGDGSKAWGYQSRVIRQQFSSPAQLMQIIAGQYPEFLHSRRVTYEPVFTDRFGQRALAAVVLEDENGNRTWDNYLLVREDGRFKVGGVQQRPGPERPR